MARILIIDDDVQVLAMLEQTLEQEGYEIVTAANGKEGVRLYREDPSDLIITDLIITDLIMPEKEGLETIMELKRDFPDVKIIAISGGGRVEPVGYLHTAKMLARLSHFKKKFNISYLLQIKVLQSRLTFLLRRDFVLAANVCSLPSISHKSPCGCLPGCLVS